MMGSGCATANGGQTNDAREAHLSYFSKVPGQYSFEGKVFPDERSMEAYKYDKARGNAY